MKLVLGGSIVNGATPSSFLQQYLAMIRHRHRLQIRLFALAAHISTHMQNHIISYINTRVWSHMYSDFQNLKERGRQLCCTHFCRPSARYKSCFWQTRCSRGWPTNSFLINTETKSSFVEIFSKHCLSQTVRARDLLSHVTCHHSFYCFCFLVFLDKVVELVVQGLSSTGLPRLFFNVKRCAICL